MNNYLIKASQSVEDQTSTLTSLESCRLKLANTLSQRLKVDLSHLNDELIKLVTKDKRTEFSLHSCCSINHNNTNSTNNGTADCRKTNFITLQCISQLGAYDRQVRIYYIDITILY